MPLIQSYALPQTVPDTMLLSLKNVVKLLENKEKKNSIAYLTKFQNEKSDCFWFLKFVNLWNINYFHNRESRQGWTSEGPLSRENEGRGVTLVCLLHYPWMRPKLFQRLLEDALWPQDTKRGHGQSLCSTQIHDPVSAYSLQSLLGFLSLRKLLVVSDWNHTCLAFMHLPWWENTL